MFRRSSTSETIIRVTTSSTIKPEHSLKDGKINQQNETNSNNESTVPSPAVGQLAPGHAHIGQKVWVQDPQVLWRIGEIQMIANDAEKTPVSPSKIENIGKSVSPLPQVQIYIPDALGNNLQWIPHKKVYAFDPSHVINHDDIAQMNNMHEAPLLNVLRQRFEQNVIYTFTADILISINPYKTIPLLYDVGVYMQQQGILKSLENKEHLDAGMQQVHDQGIASINLDGSRRPPHLFTIAENAYTNMKGVIMGTGTPQSIIISGESGAGKTEASKYIMKYLATASKLSSSPIESSSSINSTNAHEKIEECVMLSNLILESFGNAKTSRNDNSSRFGKYIQIHYNSQGRMIMVSIRHFLLEKTRLVLPPANERNYHIFYQLIAGLGCTDDLTEDNEVGMSARRKRLRLHQDVWRYNFTSLGECVEIDGVDDITEFAQLCACMDQLGMTMDEFQMPMFEILAAILHLGNVRFEPVESQGDAGSIQSSYHDDITRAVFPDENECEQSSYGANGGITSEFVSSLLGISASEFMMKMVTQTTITGRGSILEIKLTPDQAKNALDAFCKYLYGEVFNHLISRINAYAKQQTVQAAEQATGLKSPASQSGKSNASAKQVSFIGILDIFGFEIMAKNSLEQLCINFTNETLQQQFNKHVFVLEQERYAQEGIEFNAIEFQDNQLCLDLIQKPPQGLLPLLEEQMLLKRKTTTDKQLLTIYHSTHLEKHAHYKKPRFECDEFVIRHYAGEVAYDVHGFLAKNTDNLHDDLLNLLRHSTHPILRAIFQPPTTPNRRSTISDNGPSSLISPTSAAKRAQSASLTGTMTVTSRFRTQLTELMEVLWATSPNYIKCIKPNNLKFPGGFSCELVRDQLIYSGVLEVVRIRQEGFPIRKRFEVFFELFWPLAVQLKIVDASQCRNNPQKCRQICETIASEFLQRANDPFLATKNDTQAVQPVPGKRLFAMGRQEIFLRYGQLEKLESFVAALLSQRATRLQAVLGRGRVTCKKYRVLKAGMLVFQALWRMHCVRRHFLKQRSSAIQFQAKYRAYRARRSFLRLRNAANRVCWMTQRYLTNQRYKRYIREKRAATTLTHWTRVYLDRTREERHRRLQHNATLRIQKWYRMQKELNAYRHVRTSIIRIQSIYRAIMYRRMYLRNRKASIVLESTVRQWLQRQRFRRLKVRVVTMQAHVRGYLDRKHFLHLRKQTIRIQSFQRQRMANKLANCRREAQCKMHHNIRGWLVRRKYLRSYVALICIQNRLKSWCLQKHFRRSRRAVRYIQTLWKRFIREKHWHREVDMLYGNHSSHSQTSPNMLQDREPSTMQYHDKLEGSEYRIRKLREQPQIFLYLQPKCYSYNTLLHHGAICGDLHVVKYVFELLRDDESEAQRLFYDINLSGRTAFHEACANAQYEIAKFLLTQIQQTEQKIKMSLEVRPIESQALNLPSDSSSDDKLTRKEKEVIFSGYLRKRRESSRWLKRYVALLNVADASPELEYYDNELASTLPHLDAKKSRRIDLEAALVKKSMDVPFAFEVHSPHLLSGRNKEGRLYFAADTELEIQQWLGQLRNIIPNSIESRLFAMHRASKYGKLEYVDFQTRKRICNLLVRKVGKKGQTVMPHAAKLYEFASPLHLVAAFVQQNAQDSESSSVGHHVPTSLEVEFIKVALWLIENGADINSHNWMGQSPLKCALNAHNYAVAKHLLDRGAIVSGLNESEMAEVQKLKAVLVKNAISSVSCSSPRTNSFAIKSIPTSPNSNRQRTMSFLQRTTASSSALLSAVKRKYSNANTGNAAPSPNVNAGMTNSYQADVPLIFLQKEPGKIRHSSYVSVFVESIGLDNPQNLYRPRVIISVVGLQRNLVEMRQQVSIQPLVLSSSLLWSFTWHMQTPLENLPHGACVVFELTVSPKDAGFSSTAPFTPEQGNPISTPPPPQSASVDGDVMSDANTYLPVCWTYIQVDQRTANSMPLNVEMYSYPMDLTLKKLQGLNAFISGDILISQGPE
uniref:Myosinlike protein putative n=1 Tax=Albugo laibachii Nc14 TaxID=890382 RepID=F0WAX0_9STRA|nr:myosinlike protein putative [Albugo laibachii Nc14]CCA18434.1 myosinlike protein putative [Albugo laibachii Nc14]|eukprot:CCA18434.1 myosinlike protein putative [Albugo laibachii Nc14]